ncbi:MAG: hypothetical protein AAF828_06530 [Bacteroidota bacterium]
MLYARPDYHSYPAWWRQYGPHRIADYTAGETSFITSLLPEAAVQLSGVEAARILYDRLGEEVFIRAIDPAQTIASPLAGVQSTEWLRASRTVGINVRTISSFYNVVKYALTLPAHIDCIHLLPIWEPGVVASLYGMASWEINPEFYSHELFIQYPHLNSVEAQLKVVVNLLHAMGKKVGMDVIPHTDRYSEMVLANPQYFEWLRRQDKMIIDHREKLHEEVATAIFAWLQFSGPAIPARKNEAGDIIPTRLPETKERLAQMPDEEKLILLFGQSGDHDTRRERRIRLVDHLYRLGYEPVPATMAPPYRGLEVDPNPTALTIDKAGRHWRDYRITQPQEMSRVFGPLTRYKLYARNNDNKQWEIDFSRPRPAVWTYVARRYAAVQAKYGFDFMRGDMSHVQMRPTGTPVQPDDYYDLLGFVKMYIQRSVPSFGYFAESFLTAPNYMAYGNEVDHLEGSQAEVTLGNLQSMVPGSMEFLQYFRHYLDVAASRKVTPAFTIITGDKDDPRFDKFYLWGNLARFFVGLFLPDLPAYYSLGFAQRDVHPYPAPNEHYTKLYVFHLEDGPKATRGPYRWGQNMDLFYYFNLLQIEGEQLLPKLVDGSTRWTVYPDPTGGIPYLAWEINTPTNTYLFVVNFAQDSVHHIRIPRITQSYQLRYSTHEVGASRRVTLADNQLVIDFVRGGEGLIFQV